MKKNLADIFDELNAEELEIVLEEQIKVDALDEAALKRIQKKVLMQTRLIQPVRQKKHIFKKRWLAVAAIAAGFVLCITIGAGAYAAEQKEYNAAVAFFDNYDLSAEGLSRGEIKAVYRDITTKSFTYSKTMEVIKNSIISETIGGMEIIQGDPTPEEMESLWNYRTNSGNYETANSDNAEGIHYEYYAEERLDSALGFEVHDRSYMEKYDKEELVWRVSFTEFEIRGYACVSGGVIVYGETPTWSSTQTSYGWISKVDDAGNIVWTSRLDNGFHHEYIAEILENEDGTYAVMSRGDLNYFCLSQYDTDGTVTQFQKTEVGNYGIWNAARLGDGYIVQLGSYMENEHARIVKVDRDGSITESISYAAEDCYYYITDMIEFQGNIYLSAYAVPKDPEAEANAGGREEIAGILAYLFGNNIWEISSEELTPLVRENYTALLLRCNPGSGTPKEFYSVEGSLGGTLACDEDGNLQWDVESITATYFSPATSSFTIGGTSYIYRYTFGKDGIIMNQEKTGQTAVYRR